MNLKTCASSTVARLAILLLLVAVAFPRIGHAQANDMEIFKFADQFNATLPMMADEYTRMDRVTPLPGRILIYDLTFISIAAANLNANEIYQIHNALSSTVPKQACGNARVRDNVLKRGVTVIYQYHGNDGVVISRVSVTPQSCGYR